MFFNRRYTFVGYLWKKQNRSNFAYDDKKEKTKFIHKMHFLFYNYSQQMNILIVMTVFSVRNLCF